MLVGAHFLYCALKLYRLLKYLLSCFVIFSPNKKTSLNSITKIEYDTKLIKKVTFIILKEIQNINNSYKIKLNINTYFYKILIFSHLPFNLKNIYSSNIIRLIINSNENMDRIPEFNLIFSEGV